MNNSRLILVGGMLMLALIGSLFLGQAVATNDYTTLGLLFASFAALIIIKSFGKNIWVMIPVFIGFGSSTQLLPVPLSVANIMTVFSIGAIVIQVAVGKQTFHWKWRAMELFMLPCLVLMTVTYMLNPVGLSVLGSSTVGSRPYLEIALAGMAYIIMSSIQVNLKTVLALPVISLVLAAFLFIGGAIAYHLPDIGIYLNVLYGGFMPHYDTSVQSGYQMAKRHSYLGAISDVLQRFTILKKDAWLPRPNKAGLTIVIMLITLIGGMLTGHRIAVVTWVAYLGIYALLCRNIRGLLLMGVVGVISIIGIYGVHHTVLEMPLSIQRSMSFIPGDWDSDVIQDAEGSLDWRFEMWEVALFEEGVIENKVFGDGFGFSARELDLAQAMSSEDGRVKMSPEDMQEYFLVSGDLHSGPITAVRFVGWAGLFFFTLLSIYLARCYWKLCRRVYNTPLWMPVVFMGIPWIFFPFKYIVLYGDYAHNVPPFIVAAGLYNLLHKFVVQYELQHVND